MWFRRRGGGGSLALSDPDYLRAVTAFDDSFIIAKAHEEWNARLVSSAVGHLEFITASLPHVALVHTSRCVRAVDL